MSFQAFNHSVNVIAYNKLGKKYGMTCAWAMQVDYDKIIMLLGSQSVTGKTLEKGDIVGVSALSKDQIDVAFKLGDNHSDTVDKFKGIEVIEDGSAILIKNSTRIMKARVIDILHLEKIEVDNLVYLEIIESKENGNDFLNMNDIRW